MIFHASIVGHARFYRENSLVQNVFLSITSYIVSENIRHRRDYAGMEICIALFALKNNFSEGRYLPEYILFKKLKKLLSLYSEKILNQKDSAHISGTCVV